MKRIAVGALALFACSLAGIANAQEKMFAKVEYVSGDRPWKCRDRCLGTLVLGDGSLALTERKQKNAKVIFSVPISTVVKVTNRIDTNGPNLGKILAFGVLALGSRRHDEYVLITAETDTKTETFVFQVEKNTSDGIVAKIEFAAKKAKEAQTGRTPVSEVR